MKKKKDFSNAGSHIFSILFILLILIELQIMVNYPEEFIWFVGVGALILVDVYLLISVSIKKKDIVYQRKDEQFENIQKGEKASYLLIKKCFQDLDERMIRMEKAVLPVSNMVELNGHKMENIIAESMLEQRKVAKILLGRSKESSETLLEGNTEIKASLSNLEKRLEQLEEGISALNMAEPETKGELNQEKYQEILTAIHHLEESLKNQLEEALVKYTIPQEQSVTVGQPAAMDPMIGLGPEPAVEPMMDLEPEPTVEPMMGLEPEPTVEPMMGLEPKVAIEPMIGLEPESAMEPMIGLEPEPTIEPMMGLEPEAAMEPMVGLEPEVAIDSMIGLEPEPAPEPEIAPEPAPVSEPAMTSFPNTNNAMTPDDIAALLAGIGAGPPQTPVIPEPEPIIEPEIKAASEPEIGVKPEAAPVSEPAPAVPDFSDPNKVMSPDDIAALLESVGTDSSSAASSSDDNINDLDVLAGLDMLMEESQEKPAMPDFSDPNKVMSPDDIAALLANI